MVEQYPVVVAHYGQPALNKLMHWAIIVMPDSKTGWAYQIGGWSTTYYLKPVERIRLLRSYTYQGKVEVGTVDKDRLPEFEQIIANGQIIHGNVNWNCQNWVVERLRDLRLANHAILEVDQAWLLEKLDNSVRS